MDCPLQPHQHGIKDSPLSVKPNNSGDAMNPKPTWPISELKARLEFEGELRAVTNATGFPANEDAFGTGEILITIEDAPEGFLVWCQDAPSGPKRFLAPEDLQILPKK
jgi:hypothetical protein